MKACPQWAAASKLLVARPMWKTHGPASLVQCDVKLFARRLWLSLLDIVLFFNGHVTSSTEPMAVCWAMGLSLVSIYSGDLTVVFLPSQRNMSIDIYWCLPKRGITWEPPNHPNQPPHLLPAAPPAHLVLRCLMVMTASPLVTKMCGTAGKRDEANLSLGMRGTSHQYNKSHIYIIMIWRH